MIHPNILSETTLLYYFPTPPWSIRRQRASISLLLLPLPLHPLLTVQHKKSATIPLL